MQFNNEQLETRRASNEDCLLPLPTASFSRPLPTGDSFDTDHRSLTTDHCFQCALQVRATDRFCRHCGAARAMRTEGLETTASLALTSGIAKASPYATAPLGTEDLYRAVSGPMVKAVTGNLVARKTARFTSRWSRGLMLALISVPVWLMIVLLSPFDAYAAARTTIEGK